MYTASLLPPSSHVSADNARHAADCTCGSIISCTHTHTHTVGWLFNIAVPEDSSFLLDGAVCRWASCARSFGRLWHLRPQGSRRGRNVGNRCPTNPASRAQSNAAPSEETPHGVYRPVSPPGLQTTSLTYGWLFALCCVQTANCCFDVRNGELQV